MAQVTGVATVWLPVTDMQRAVGFYTEKLGLTVTQQQDEWSELEADGLKIGLNAKEDPAQGDGGAVVAFTPDKELEDTVAELEADGVEFSDGISDHPWGRIAPFRDPDGNALQFYTPPKQG